MLLWGSVPVLCARGWWWRWLFCVHPLYRARLGNVLTESAVGLPVQVWVVACDLMLSFYERSVNRPASGQKPRAKPVSQLSLGLYDDGSMFTLLTAVDLRCVCCCGQCALVTDCTDVLVLRGLVCRSQSLCSHGLCVDSRGHSLLGTMI